MNSYTYPDGLFVKKSYDYAFMEFDFFRIREVINSNGATGEYHIALVDNSNLKNAVQFFQRQFTGQNVGLVDPSGELQLDYPIYLIIKDELMKTEAHNIFELINSELKQKYGKESTQ